jgi:hypothetical protein
MAAALSFARNGLQGGGFALTVRRPSARSTRRAPELRRIMLSADTSSPRSMASCAASGRIAAGGHYFTDFVFARLFMYFLVWLVHRLIYRRTTSTLGKDEVEAAVERIAIAMRKKCHLRDLTALRVRHRDKSSLILMRML